MGTCHTQQMVALTRHHSALLWATMIGTDQRTHPCTNVVLSLDLRLALRSLVRSGAPTEAYALPYLRCTVEFATFRGVMDRKMSC